MKAWLIFLVALWLPSLSLAQDLLPRGMSFIGLTAEGWRAFTVDENGLPERVSDLTEPREFTWSPSANRMVFIRADGTISDRQNAVTNTLVPSDAADAFTQIRLGEQGQSLIAIRLFERKSERTALTVWQSRQQRFSDIHQQLGKIFDPDFNDENFLFSVVSCMLDCGGIVQEAWLKNRVTHRAKQLTLHNGIVRYPVWDTQQQRTVYSFRASTHFQLWQTDSSGRSTQLTHSEGTDLWPSLSPSGVLYFVRRAEGRGRLMRLGASGAVEIKLEHILDIRDLEITQ
ncbi:hypothetical protein L6J37_10495 [Photobacterium sp. WH77]|uniref:TolB family protein n=1 Tax=unclassified Photobacterium TaxID=2628852 RepID=UPI001EDBF9FD|nr:MULTISPECIES: hypothetical protein [unclassified Photobacterium]MCG2837263.1 hypothetical protein [Photobacterium sp. WH77]MCG2844879.1 hypothetical protein [Photobacterium sp. WH80]